MTNFYSDHKISHTIRTCDRTQSSDPLAAVPNVIIMHGGFSAPSTPTSLKHQWIADENDYAIKRCFDRKFTLEKL